MIEALLLGPSAAGTIVFVALKRPQVWRLRAALAVLGLGAGASLGLIEGEAWRTVQLGPATTIAGAASACAWLLVLADDRSRQWATAALVGLCATGLALAAGAQWLAPGLFFWLASSLALAALARSSAERSTIWIELGVSDALLFGVLISSALDASEWSMPGALQGWRSYVVVAAVLIRSGAIPHIGAWRLIGSPGSPAIPLLVGSAFVGAYRWGPSNAAVLAGVALVAAMALCTSMLVVRRPQVTAIGAWPVLVAVALALITREAIFPSAVAATISSSLVALWARERSGGPACGLVLSLTSLTPGFWAILIAATYSFGRVIDAQDLVEEAPWIAVSALLPFALAGGVALATRIGRSASEQGAARGPLLGIAALTLTSVGLALAPAGLDVPDGLLGPAVRTSVLHGVAVVVGGGAGWLARKRTLREVTRRPDDAFAFNGEGPSRRAALVMSWVALLFGFGTALATAWITYRGLEVGFL